MQEIILLFRFRVFLCLWDVPDLCVSLVCHRDQVYLVSLRESYRNEIIPYRVRLCPGDQGKPINTQGLPRKNNLINRVPVLQLINEDVKTLIYVCERPSAQICRLTFPVLSV